MKRLVMVLILVFCAATVFAGGKECNINKAKSVELTGTIASVGSGAEAKTVFRVANSNDSYTVCEKTKASLLKLDGSVQIKGKLVSCSDGEGQELVIESAKKV